MPLFDSNIEIERIRNLITNFDWTIEKQKVTNDEIALTITKQKPVPEVQVSVAAS